MRWRVGFVCVVIVGLIGLVASSAANEAGVAELMQRGDAYRDAYLYTAARDTYRQALDRQPARADLLLRLCDVALRLGEVGEATAYADRAEAAGADRVALATCRARLAESGGQLDRAAAQWSIVAGAPAVDRAARGRLLEAQLAAHDWPAALATANALREANPADATAAFYAGALLALDDPVQARSILRGVYTAEAAVLLAALDEPFSQVDRLYRAVAIGRVFLEYDRLSLAWRVFIDATTANPNYPDAFAYLGAVYGELGDATLATAYLDRALELDAQSVIGLYLRGVYALHRSAWVEARADLEHAAQLAPDNAAIEVALGQVLAEQGEYRAAEEHLLRGVTLQPERPAWQLALAEFYVGRLIQVSDKGVPAALRAVELAPQNASARDWLGWGWHLSGDDTRAEATLRTAVTLDPALARTRLHLGNLLIDVGRIEEGRTELQRAVDLDPQGEIGARARQLLGAP